MDLKKMIQAPLGAIYAVKNGSGAVEVKRDYKKAMVDAFIVAFIAAMSVLMAFGYPPTPEAVYATTLALLFGFFTSLARRLDIEVEE